MSPLLYRLSYAALLIGSRSRFTRFRASRFLESPLLGTSKSLALRLYFSIGCQEGPWLYSIARRIALDHLRHHKVRRIFRFLSLADMAPACEQEETREPGLEEQVS
jgi:hypothetical protein